MSTTDFSLRRAVRAVLDETDETDPGIIGGLAIDGLTRKDRDAALAEAMRPFVRQIISEVRIANRASSRARGDNAGARNAALSAKVAAVREDHWQRRLRDRLHVGGGKHKMIADCTYDDLIAAADERQDLAERNSAWAREYRVMASAVLDAGVATFGDLPAATQAAVLGGAA